MTAPRPAAPTLIVEDDLVLRKALAGALDDAGLSPIECADLSTARAAIERMQPRVVVLDLSLDGEFGGDLLEELASRDDAPPVVVCSAFGLATMLAARFSVPCVRKPFELDALVSAVESAIANQRRPRRSRCG